jgi:hypothetical protein
VFTARFEDLHCNFARYTILADSSWDQIYNDTNWNLPSKPYAAFGQAGAASHP